VLQRELRNQLRAVDSEQQRAQVVDAMPSHAVAEVLVRVGTLLD
jgi:hypothetical protein